MAVVNVKEHREGRKGQWSVSPFKATATRQWVIIVDDPNDDEVTVFAQTLGILPAPLQSHPSSPLLTRRDLTITQSADWQKYYATAEYSTEPIGEDQDEDPLARPAKIRWHSVQYERLYTRDRDGNAILTPTGDPYEASDYLFDDTRWKATVEKNLAPPLPPWILAINNRVNASLMVVDGLPVGAELLKAHELEISESLIENDVLFRRVSLTLSYKEDGWNLSLPHLSYNYLEQANQKKTKRPFKLKIDYTQTPPTPRPEATEPQDPQQVNADGTIANPDATPVGYTHWPVLKTFDPALLLPLLI